MGGGGDISKTEADVTLMRVGARPPRPVQPGRLDPLRPRDHPDRDLRGPRRDSAAPASALITVRPATADEYERVGTLTVAAYRALAVDHLWGGYDEEILDVEKRAAHGEILVAVVDDRVVGSVMYVDDAASEWSEWTEPGEVQFRLLAVDPAAQAAWAPGWPWYGRASSGPKPSGGRS